MISSLPGTQGSTQGSFASKFESGPAIFDPATGEVKPTVKIPNAAMVKPPNATRKAVSPHLLPALTSITEAEDTDELAMFRNLKYGIQNLSLLILPFPFILENVS